MDPILLAIDRGLSWLLAQQAESGAWPSVTYGKLRAGIANTALVVRTLAELSQRSKDLSNSHYERGVRFLERRFLESATLPRLQSGIEYPVYSAALLLQSLQSRPLEVHSKLRSQLLQLLKREQRVPENQWQAGAQTGGWGPWIEEPGERLLESPANVSCTRMALQALSGEKELTDVIITNATRFLDACSATSSDAAFGTGSFFTPQPESPLNKAGVRSNENGTVQAVPYHSATCDAILARQVIDPGISSKDISRQIESLTRLTIHLPPKSQSEEGQPPSMETAIFFYDAAVFSKVWSLSPDERLTTQRQIFLDELSRLQRRNGSWINPNPWFFEDDPFIATCFAIQALFNLSKSR